MQINMTESTIVYVVVPGFYKTGGTELAHQLVSEINSIGRKAIVTYYQVGDNPVAINPAFMNYVDEFITIGDVVDSSTNVIIVPEINVGMLNRFVYIQKCVWWMSVDNYLISDGLWTAIKYYGLLRTIKRYISGQRFGNHNAIDPKYTHFYQSEYAHKFLIENGIADSEHLSDYINSTFASNDEFNNRKNVVLYNPKKGVKFTQKIMNKATNIEWKPLANMSTDEIHYVLLESKLYIDFGEHPGKDRFPREAAISGCCVITGMRGSAKFYEDVPIDSEFKFADKSQNIGLIIAKMEECLYKYDIVKNKFDGYRKYIASEYDLFRKDVTRIFGREK